MMSLSVITAGCLAISTNLPVTITSPLATNLVVSGGVVSCNGKVVSDISQPGIYAVMSPDGRGGQAFSYGTLSGMRALSLGHYLVTNLWWRTNGFSDPSTARKLYSTINHAGLEFVRNTNSWLFGIPEVTAISVHRSDLNGACGVTAISPRHVIGAAHAGLSPGVTLVWVDDYGTNVSRTVTSVATTTNDVLVALLNADLPDSIHPPKLAPSWLPDRLRYPLVAIHSGKEASHRVAQGAFWGPLLGGMVIAAADYINAGSAAMWLPEGWKIATADGDSGHGVFFVLPNQLVLAGHWWGPGNPADHTETVAGINWLMASLSTAAGAPVYTVQIADIPSLPFDY